MRCREAQANPGWTAEPPCPISWAAETAARATLQGASNEFIRPIDPGGRRRRVVRRAVSRTRGFERHGDGRETGLYRRPSDRGGAAREGQPHADAARFAEQADDHLHGLRAAQERPTLARRQIRRQPQGLADGRFQDVRRGRQTGAGRGSAAGDHRSVGQRRLHRHRRGPVGFGKRVRRCDEPEGGGNRADRHQFGELDRMAGRYPPDEPARPRRPGPAHRRGIPGILPLFRREIVSLQQDQAGQPQPSALSRYRGRTG